MDFVRPLYGRKVRGAGAVFWEVGGPNLPFRQKNILFLGKSPFRKNLHTFFDSYFIICKLSENIFWKPDSQKTSERCNENICDRVKEILILGKGAFAENKKNFLAELLAGGLEHGSQPPARRRLAVFLNVTRKASIF